MNHRALPFAALALLHAIACGNACTSVGEPVASSSLQNGCGVVAAATPMTIAIPICPDCTDTSPSCSGELLSGSTTIELSSTAQQCSGETACASQACAITFIECPVNATLVAGTTYTITYLLPGNAVGSTTALASLGGATSCDL